MKNFCVKKGFGYAMLGQNLEDIEILKLKNVNTEVVNLFRDFVRENGYIYYEQFCAFKKLHPIGVKEILKTIIENDDINFQQHPFRFRSMKNEVMYE